MKPFMNEDFLLDTQIGRTLFHQYAKEQPIFDYHNHLPVKDIALHRCFRNLTQLWLEGDHYKWRAMRCCGEDERYITGDASDYEKFLAWARCLPKLIGNPLYHWTHLELQRYFGITKALSLDTAESIWKQTEEMLREEGFDCVSLLKKMKVRVLCTTDDPADSLEWHKKIRKDSTIPFRVCPSFRPDRYLFGGSDQPAAQALCSQYHTSDVGSALLKALDYFDENGCLVSDHGFCTFPSQGDEVFAARMRLLGEAYEEHHMVMQLHLGAIRNNSPRLKVLLGADAGGDSVGPLTSPEDLSAFFGDLEERGHLPRTILYNLNRADNEMLATMAVNYAPKVQYGAAWWFNDHIRGIELQLQELMETGALGASVGMLTDSRSFTSFVRHEYFRRILCRSFGRLVEQGEYPEDLQTLGQIVADICYGNAEKFFV